MCDVSIIVYDVIKHVHFHFFPSSLHLLSVFNTTISLSIECIWILISIRKCETVGNNEIVYTNWVYWIRHEPLLIVSCIVNFSTSHKIERIFTYQLQTNSKISTVMTHKPYDSIHCIVRKQRKKCWCSKSNGVYSVSFLCNDNA